jgi:glutamine amidotransferase
VRGLGVIAGSVRWISADVPRPQMQWNRVVVADAHRDDPVLGHLGAEPWMYFVHSLHGEPADGAVVAATCDYGGTVHAAFRHGNVLATQFHPEKSGRDGLTLLGAFVRQVAAVAS